MFNLLLKEGADPELKLEHLLNCAYLLLAFIYLATIYTCRHFRYKQARGTRAIFI
jgi:hypothetical protein